MLLINILLLLLDTSPKGISEVNSLKKKAQEAYQSGNFEQSATTYSYLVDSLNLVDEKAIMNLANSYYKLEDTENALSTYQRLQGSIDPELRSQAYQQMGVLSKDPKTLEKALAFFKESIKSDPSNNDARYNYELVKKKLQEQEKQDQNQQDQDKQDQEQNEDEKQEENKDKENQDQNKEGQENQDDKGQQSEEDSKENEESQENQEQEQQEGGEEKQDEQEGDNQEEQQEQPQQDEQDGEQEQQEGKEGEEGEENEQQAPPPKSTSEKLQEMNISEEKAKMILEALKNSEIQYIQQNRRKPTKRQDSNKPDW